MNSTTIDEIIEDLKLPKFRGKQLKEAVFNKYVDSYEDVTSLNKDLRIQLSEKYPLLKVELYRLFISADRRCYKAILKLKDGRLIESVLMSPKEGLWTTCISSQVGCALACNFCATGTMGLLRNLESEEITDQVLFWLQYIKKEKLGFRLNNIVYMGMGEPLHNTKEVFKSIAEFNNPETFNIGSRHISVSTSGMVKGIYELAEKFPQVNLAISLHAANDELRTSMMPINKRWPLEKLTESLNDYLKATNRKIFIEYILLDEENDSIKDADELIALMNRIRPKKLVHINLIVYNSTKSKHTQSKKENARRFKDHLMKNGIQATIRKNLGRDINGACGQLVVEDQIR